MKVAGKGVSAPADKPDYLALRREVALEALGLKLDERLRSLEVPAQDAPAPAPELIFTREGVNLTSYESFEHRTTDGPTPGLKSFYNKYKGQRCFIVGNGPSLNKHNLALLEGEQVFAVNSFYYKTRETGFLPTFFVVEDSKVMEENYQEFINYKAPYKFFPTEYKKYHPEGEGVFFFRMNHGFYQNGSPFYNVPRFSADAYKALYCGQSVTYINLQLAFYMGFTEVYLIGMDFDYVIPKEHQRTGNDILSTTDDPNHFHKDYFGKGKTWRDPKLDRVLLNYRQAKLSYEAVGRKIYNATIGGKLEIFERVDYDHLLKTGVKRAPAASAAPVAKAPVAAAAQTPPLVRQQAYTPPPSYEEPAPTPRAFYASFGEWLAQRSPPLFALLRMSRRAVAGAWRRRALTVPAAILLAVPLVLAFLPGFEAERPWLLGAGAFLIALAATAYVAMRMYAFALSTNAETKRLAHQISDVQALKSALDAAVAGLKTELNLRVAEADTRAARLKRDVDATLKTLRADSESRHDSLWRGLGKLTENLDAIGADNEQRAAALRSELSAQSRSAQEDVRAYAEAISRETTERDAKFTGSLEKALENIRKVAEAQSAAEQKIVKLSERSISTHLAAALRSMRPFWTGISAVKALQNQVEFEHGHELMMAVLADEERQRPGAIVGKCLIEIGTTREAVPSQSSTQKLALFTAMMGMRFITVDMDPENTKAANNIMRLLNPAAQALTGRGEDYLPRHPGPLEFVYLDAFDFDHGMHSEARKDKYRTILGTDITDPACWKMHEACAESIIARMEPDGIVVLDDTWTDENSRFAGKGKLAVPLLLDHGFQIIARTRQTIALKRVSLAP